MAIMTRNTKPEQISVLGSEEQAGLQRVPIFYRAFPMIGQAGPVAAVALPAGCPIRFVNTGGQITCVKAGGASYVNNLAAEGKVDGYTYQAYDAGQPVCVVEEAIYAGYLDATITKAGPANLYLSAATAGEFDDAPPFVGAFPIARLITDGKNLAKTANTVKGSLHKVWSVPGL
jgi:hypothetical protein